MRHLVSHKPLTFLRFLRSVLLPLAVALGLFYWWFDPPMYDFTLMTALMSVTALVSLLAAYAAYRLGWINRLPYLRWTLMSGYAFAGLVIFLNVWVIARLMFADQHDLALATVLVVFASGIAVSLSFVLSEALTERIVVLGQAANLVAQGQLGTRVQQRGRDEVACLAEAFNSMAAQLETTERKQREVEILRRDLIAWIGHDLRTPLTSIRAMLEALADGVVEDPQTVQRYLRTAQKEIRSLSHLIDDLFEIAQLDAGGLQLERQPSSLSDLISDTLESFTELATRQGISLEGRADAQIDPVCMDVQRVGRVLSNLLGNAVRHTPPGGKVEIWAARQQDQVQVSVSDNGEGIKAEDLPYVFDRFYRGEKSRSRSTGGAGLGLAIAKGIIEAHGGQIGVESSASQGARFYFSLPV